MSKKLGPDAASFVDLLNTVAARGLLHVFDPRTKEPIRIVSAQLDLLGVLLVPAEPSKPGEG